MLSLTVQYPLGILLILNLAMKAGSSISLQYLWDYINSLQLIALIPLMGLTLPSNLQTMLNYIAGPLSFNFLENANFGVWLFNLDEDTAGEDYPAYNTVFSEYGYDSTLAVLNLQDTVIYLFIFVNYSEIVIFGTANLHIERVCLVLVLLPFAFATVKMKRMQEKFRPINYLANQAEQTIFWGFILRIFIENMLPLFMCCLINMLQPYGQYSKWKELEGGKGELAATILAYITFIIMLITVTLVTVIMLKAKSEQLSEKSGLTTKIGSFYEEIRIDSRWALLYTPIFLLRRILFCIFVLALEDYPLAQVILLIISTGLYLLYLFLVRPFHESGTNRMAILNECFVLVVCFCLLGFVDDICCDDEYTQFYLGWFVIAWLNLICAPKMPEFYQLQLVKQSFRDTYRIELIKIILAQKSIRAGLPDMFTLQMEGVRSSHLRRGGYAQMRLGLLQPLEFNNKEVWSAFTLEGFLRFCSRASPGIINGAIYRCTTPLCLFASNV